MQKAYGAVIISYRKKFPSTEGCHGVAGWLELTERNTLHTGDKTPPPTHGVI